GEPVPEDRLLRHEAHQALLRERGEPVEDEVQIADVIAHQHGTARTRDVLRSPAVDPEVPHLEHRAGETDDGTVDEFCHECGGPFCLPGKGIPAEVTLP